VTAGSIPGYTVAKQRLAQERSIVPIQVLIIAELSHSKGTIRASVGAPKSSAEWKMG
jgi:hypothetical protein